MATTAAEAIDMDDITMDEENEANQPQVQTECTIHQNILQLVIIGDWGWWRKRT